MLKKSKLLSAAIFSAATLLAANGQADTMGTPKISAMSIVNGLENPWDMAFTKNGDMFFTEKCKFLKRKKQKTSEIWSSNDYLIILSMKILVKVFNIFGFVLCLSLYFVLFLFLNN